MNRARHHGFTLIEIMVVVVILGVLVGLVAPNILGRVDTARVTAAQTDIETLGQALELYKLDNHHYPSTDQGLEALITKPTGSPEPRNWNSAGYLKKRSVPLDPWGNDYVYLSVANGSRFELYSLGADGREGGDGYNADIGVEDSDT